MPKIIDHAERRDEIAAAVLRVVARHGVRGVTMREVAAEAGWSTGVLDHYFENKRDLLVGGLRLAARQTGVNVTRALTTTDARERLRLVIEEGMPLDERRAALCRIFFFFWAEGVTDPDLWSELARYYDWWRDQIRALLEDGQRDGWVRRDSEPQRLAEALVALADGVAVQAMFSRRTMSAERQRGHVRTWIAMIGEGAVTPVAPLGGTGA